uniref:Uncharacterized protein n=1 Tax=Sphaerodactylus townsendi TaxID=933632 RepID=A0ACB8EP96_9SAUR
MLSPKQAQRPFFRCATALYHRLRSSGPFRQHVSQALLKPAGCPEMDAAADCQFSLLLGGQLFLSLGEAYFLGGGQTVSLLLREEQEEEELWWPSGRISAWLAGGHKSELWFIRRQLLVCSWASWPTLGVIWWVKGTAGERGDVLMGLPLQQGVRSLSSLWQTLFCFRRCPPTPIFPHLCRSQACSHRGFRLHVLLGLLNQGAKSPDGEGLPQPPPPQPGAAHFFLQCSWESIHIHRGRRNPPPASPFCLHAQSRPAPVPSGGRNSWGGGVGTTSGDVGVLGQPLVAHFMAQKQGVSSVFWNKTHQVSKTICGSGPFETF